MANMDCIFCKIVAGEVPSYKLFENDATLAFLEIRPVNPGHTLVIPKIHSKNILEITPNDWAAVSETVRKVAGIIEQGLQADGVNLMMNNREHAGQLVDHTHVHVIPRFRGDGFKHWAQRPYKEGEAEAVLAKLRAAN